MRRVGNFRQKNNSAEDRIDGTIGYFRRNSGCSAEQKNLVIPFRTLPRKRKQLGIPFRGTKIEANSHNSVPNPSAEENTTRNSVPWYQNECKFLEFRSEHSAKEKPTQNKTRQPNISIKVTEKTTFDVQTYHFVELILIDSLLQEIIAAMALLGSLLKWNRESVPRLEQSVRGYIKNFYNKTTRGTMRSVRILVRLC